MRGARQAIVVGLVMGVLVGAAWAADGGQPSRGELIWHKLGRGAANLVGSPLEIVRNVHNTTKEDSVLIGWTVGLGKGLGYALLRAGVGAFEIVTCPFPIPAGYEPVIEPEYIWDEPGPKLR